MKPGIEKSGRRAAWPVGLYFLLLFLVCNLGSLGGLPGIPIGFLLKDRLKLGPEQMAFYGFLLSLPGYGGVLLGLLRDRWQPIWREDRGYLVVLPPIIAGLMLWLSVQPLTYGRILAVSLASSPAGMLLGIAIQGRMADTARRHLLSGRLSAVANASGILPAVIGLYAGGWLASQARPESVLRMAAGIIMLAPLFVFLRPREVFPGLSAENMDANFDTPLREPIKRTVRRLLRHRPIYLPAAILFFWWFAPGWNTPLFFYLTDTIKLTGAEYGSVRAVQLLATMALVLYYGALCKRVSLTRLLWIGVTIGILGGPLFWFIHAPVQAYFVSAIAGASCGIANGAITDLLIRSCPRGSEGVGMALSGVAVTLAVSSSDIFGSWLYARGGFGLALLITLITGFFMFIPMAMVDRRLLAPKDGEALPEEEVIGALTLQSG